MEHDLTRPPGSLTSSERQRYAALAELLDVPCDPAQVELFTFLSRWLTPPSLAQLDAMVRKSNGRAQSRCRELLGDVAGPFDERHSESVGECEAVALPCGLVARIRTGAKQ